MITGKVTSVYGNDINTDDIIPASYLQQSTDRKFFARYAFDKYDPEFRDRCQQTETNIVISGENFACGSSREQAVYAIKENNVVCVIAQSYPDIFYRNSLSNGLVLIMVPDASAFQLGDDLRVDLDTYTIENVTQGTTIRFEMTPDDQTTFKQGGMIGRVRNHLEEILQA
ncbi:MAG: 3-isopropylmalate dehydratase small subunit [bacterium]|nr:3-isopropylmalate dehydratase small subunit [bacterium]